MKLQQLSMSKSANISLPAVPGLPPKMNSAVTRTQREEMLIVDDRTAIRPAQMVENKLLGLLGASPVGVSSLRLSRLLAARPAA